MLRPTVEGDSRPPVRHELRYSAKAVGAVPDARALVELVVPALGRLALGRLRVVRSELGVCARLGRGVRERLLLRGRGRRRRLAVVRHTSREGRLGQVERHPRHAHPSRDRRRLEETLHAAVGARRHVLVEERLRRVLPLVHLDDDDARDHDEQQQSDEEDAARRRRQNQVRDLGRAEGRGWRRAACESRRPAADDTAAKDDQHGAHHLGRCDDLTQQPPRKHEVEDEQRREDRPEDGERTVVERDDLEDVGHDVEQQADEPRDIATETNAAERH